MNHWIFQYTDTIYPKIIEDIRGNRIEKWEVRKHIKNIKNSDNIVIYVGGSVKKICALAKTTSDVYFDESKERFYVNIKIIEILIDCELTLYSIKKDLFGIPVGISGTNFSLTNIKYNELLSWINSYRNFGGFNEK